MGAPTVETQLALLVQTSACQSDKIDDMHRVLCGNGAPETGLIVRVDRIEQAGRTRARRWLTLWVPVGLIVIAAAVRVIIYGTG